jgi:formylglycine-generating enzyme required for sulfatase activity
MFIKEDLQMNFPANLSASDCPQGYVPVPGNTLYGTSSFCVMKYEAKVDETGDGIGDTNTDCNYSSTIFSWKNNASTCSYTENNREIVSTAEGYPLAYISQSQSKAACASIGEGYHLITNEEWMTIVRNIERQPENWTGGQIGSGVIKRGSVGDCEGCYDSSDSRTDPDFGTGRDETAKLVLSNGSSIWDLSGNMWEWVDTKIQLKYEPQPSGDIYWFEGEITDYGIKGRKAYTPLNLDYNIDHGIGYMKSIYNSGTSQRAFRRGGDWGDGTLAGPFAVSLDNYSGDPRNDSGFRCSVVPS